MKQKPVRCAGSDPTSWDTFKLSHLIPRASGLCLDLGCGPGARRELTSMGYAYLGVDRFRVAGADVITDAACLPFGDTRFDLVLAASSFEHFPDPWQVGREVARVLKPGGVAVVSLSFLEPYHDHSHFHMTHLGAARLFESAGLHILVMEPFEWSGPEALAQAMFQLRIMRWAVALVARPVLWLRRLAIRGIIRCLPDGGKKERAREFLAEEMFRFTAGIKLKLQRPAA